jgi:hypothetical protein
MITQIESNLRAVNDKPIIKSMLISPHFQFGILKGFSNPPGFI